MEIGDITHHSTAEQPQAERLKIYEQGFKYLDFYNEQRTFLRETLLSDGVANDRRVELVDGANYQQYLDCRYSLNPSRKTEEYSPNKYTLTNYLFLEEQPPNQNAIPFATELYTQLVHDTKQELVTYSFYIFQLYPDGQVVSFYDQTKLGQDQLNAVEHGCHGPYIDELDDDVAIFDFTGNDYMKPGSAPEITLDDYAGMLVKWRSELVKITDRAQLFSTKSPNEPTDNDF